MDFQQRLIIMVSPEDELVLDQLEFFRDRPAHDRKLFKRLLDTGAGEVEPCLETFSASPVPPGVEPYAFAATARAALAEAGRADIRVYVEAEPAPPPAVTSNPLRGQQRHLMAAPWGIGVGEVQSWFGATGSYAHLVDVEQGWLFQHEDLPPAPSAPLPGGLNYDYHGHGTSVLGLLVGVDNGYGGIGIVPNATAACASSWREYPASHSIALAIEDAVLSMKTNDILILQAQAGYGGRYLPVEAIPEVFCVIHYATHHRGIHVIEAAGNGGLNLNTYVPTQELPHGFAAGDEDSGAVLVGAGTPTPRPPTPPMYRRMDFSNYGTRVDCYAAGALVTAPGNGDRAPDKTEYTTRFKGTSSATAIVAGAAAVIVSVLGAQGKYLSPVELRDALKYGGTPTEVPSDDLIGVMPNLEMAIPEAVRRSSPITPAEAERANPETPKPAALPPPR